MKKDIVIKQKLIDRIQKLSNDQLQKLVNFLKGIESSTNQKQQVLSYAGTWNDLKTEIVTEFTTDLHKRRKTSRKKS